MSKDRAMKIFFEAFDGMPRLGPGQKVATQRAYRALNLPAEPRILDVGCGNGRQTLDLAEISSGRITAVDNYAPFLDQLLQEADERGIGERIQTACMDMAALDDPKAEQLHRKVKTRLPEDVGKAAYLIWLDFKSIIAFTGEMFAALVWAIRHPGRVRFGDVWMLAEKAGADALPVAAMLGWLIGSITAYQTAAPLRQFGSGSDVFIADIVAAAMIREMGPLITAILLAGRSGSAFAAEIGTMKVTEEINALTTLGLDPVRFLVVPRVLAAVLVTPLLSVFASFVGIAGGYAVFASMGYPLATFIRRVTGVVGYVDLLGGVFKAFVFALLIAGIGCLRGIQTRSGPGAVGDSTTRAVVAGIVLILITDGILGAIYFHLGI